MVRRFIFHAMVYTLIYFTGLMLIAWVFAHLPFCSNLSSQSHPQKYCNKTWPHHTCTFISKDAFNNIDVCGYTMQYEKDQTFHHSCSPLLFLIWCGLHSQTDKIVEDISSCSYWLNYIYFYWLYSQISPEYGFLFQTSKKPDWLVARSPFQSASRKVTSCKLWMQSHPKCCQPKQWSKHTHSLVQANYIGHYYLGFCPPSQFRVFPMFKCLLEFSPMYKSLL